MFTRIELTNFAAFAQLDWPDHSAMNVIIGENDTGKSHLLKILYAFGRSITDYYKKKDGPQPISWAESFNRKLLWTFQPNKFNDQYLVKNGKETLKIMAWIGEQYLPYSVSRESLIKHTEDGESRFEIPRIGITPAINQVESIGLVGRTVFLPPKEILTAMQAIEATRERIEIAGFDDTYTDLIEDFRASPTYGRIESGLKNIPDKIKNILSGGEIVEKGLEFVFKRGAEEYSMSQTAEGFKKIGILSRLILNRSLTKGSILLVDEPEAVIDVSKNDIKRLFTPLQKQLKTTLEGKLSLFDANGKYLTVCMPQHLKTKPNLKDYIQPAGDA